MGQVTAMTRIGEIDSTLAVAAGHLNAQHALLVDLTIELLADRSAWAGPGVERADQYLAWKTGLSPQRAKQIVRIAERAEELPVTMEAFRRGELAVDQVAAVVLRAPWWADREVCELARHATVHQLRSALGRYPFPDIARPVDPHGNPVPGGEPTHGGDTTVPPAGEAGADDQGAESPTQRRAATPTDHLWFGTGDDGRFRLQFECDQLTGMTIEAALREARDRLFHDGHPDLDWTDAVRDVCERSLDSVTEPARRDRYRVHVHLRTDGVCCDDRGAVLADAIARYITCDGTVTPTFVDGAIPVSVGRTGRVIPERTRRLVILRDGGCRVPGCSQTHVLEVHHIIHWEHHGPTDTWNLVALCPHHHRMHHRGELGIAGNADLGTVVFTDRHGNPLRPSGARPQPPGAPPPTPAGVYDHPLGERLDTQWLYFNPPPGHRHAVARLSA